MDKRAVFPHDNGNTARLVETRLGRTVSSVTLTQITDSGTCQNSSLSLIPLHDHGHKKTLNVVFG